MAQITTGLRSALSLPVLYTALQNALGAKRVREVLCNEYIRAQPGDIVVDVGCGPADILRHIRVPIHYHGFDLSPSYIDAARAAHGDRGQFRCADITQLPIDEIPPCQVAIAIGLLHHLDDEGARQLIANLHERLAPGGRLVTFDGAYWAGQSIAARYMLSKDRGQNVRSGDGYRDLALGSFQEVELIRRDDLLNLPYTHAILVCTK